MEMLSVELCVESVFNTVCPVVSTIFGYVLNVEGFLIITLIKCSLYSYTTYSTHIYTHSKSTLPLKKQC